MNSITNKHAGGDAAVRAHASVWRNRRAGRESWADLSDGGDGDAPWSFTLDNSQGDGTLRALADSPTHADESPMQAICQAPYGTLLALDDGPGQTAESPTHATGSVPYGEEGAQSECSEERMLATAPAVVIAPPVTIQEPGNFSLGPVPKSVPSDTSTSAPWPSWEEMEKLPPPKKSIPVKAPPEQVPRKYPPPNLVSDAIAKKAAAKEATAKVPPHREPDVPVKSPPAAKGTLPPDEPRKKPTAIRYRAAQDDRDLSRRQPAVLDRLATPDFPNRAKSRPPSPKGPPPSARTRQHSRPLPMPGRASPITSWPLTETDPHPQPTAEPVSPQEGPPGAQPHPKPPPKADACKLQQLDDSLAAPAVMGPGPPPLHSTQDAFCKLQPQGQEFSQPTCLHTVWHSQHTFAMPKTPCEFSPASCVSTWVHGQSTHPAFFQPGPDPTHMPTMQASHVPPYLPGATPIAPMPQPLSWGYGPEAVMQEGQGQPIMVHLMDYMVPNETMTASLIQPAPGASINRQPSPDGFDKNVVHSYYGPRWFAQAGGQEEHKADSPKIQTLDNEAASSSGSQPTPKMPRQTLHLPGEKLPHASAKSSRPAVSPPGENQSAPRDASSLEFAMHILPLSFLYIMGLIMGDLGMLID